MKWYQTAYSNRRYSNNAEKGISISISGEKDKKKTAYEKAKENSRYDK